MDIFAKLLRKYRNLDALDIMEDVSQDFIYNERLRLFQLVEHFRCDRARFTPQEKIDFVRWQICVLANWKCPVCGGYKPSTTRWVISTKRDLFLCLACRQAGKVNSLQEFIDHADTEDIEEQFKKPDRWGGRR